MQTVCSIQFRSIGMSEICLHINFETPDLITQRNKCVAAMLFFHIIKNILNRSYVIFEYLVWRKILETLYLKFTDGELNITDVV
jgi:hypothetical protein